MAEEMSEQVALETVNAGLQMLGAGQLGEAEAVADAVLDARKDDLMGLYLKAQCRRVAGDPESALRLARKLARARPDEPIIVVLLALCVLDTGDGETAIRLLKKVQDEGRPDADLSYNLASLLYDKGDRRGAVDAYDRALAVNPDHYYAIRGLAHTLSELGEDRRAEALALRVTGQVPDDPVALSVLCRADVRRGEPAKGVARMQLLWTQNPDAVNTAIALGRLGEAKEATGDFTGAFEAWKTANDRLRTHFADQYAGDSGAYSLDAAKRVRRFNEGLSPSSPKPQGDGPAPVFLVGFQRAGTTLMEQILAAHPAITTTGEDASIKPLVDAAGRSEGELAELMKGDPDRMKGLRKAYWKSAGGAPKPGEVFIDKLPLNMMWLGVIAQVFPDAKILLALRDPRDVVLSAFQQRFGMNSANYAMLTVEGTAGYYDAATGAGTAAMRAFPDLSVLEVRYEDLVGDVEGQAKRMIGFLGLDWDPSVMDYREKAKTRTITTPSATQVTEPVYTKSIGRWKDYRFALEPVLPTLDYWAKHWGYAAE